MRYRIRRRDDKNAEWQPVDRERVLVVLHPAYFDPVAVLRGLDENLVTTLYTGGHEIRRNPDWEMTAPIVRRQRQTDEASDIFA